MGAPAALMIELEIDVRQACIILNPLYVFSEVYLITQVLNAG